MEEYDFRFRRGQLIMVNIVEEFVKEKVKESIKELGACECDTCYLNACALALNVLPPKYVTTTKGALITEVMAMKLATQTNILVEVTKAVMQVMQSPHHDV